MEQNPAIYADDSFWPLMQTQLEAHVGVKSGIISADDDRRNEYCTCNHDHIHSLD